MKVRLRPLLRRVDANDDGTESVLFSLRGAHWRPHRRTLAAYLANRGLEPQRALALIDEEMTDRGGPETEDVRAWVLYRLGRLDEALAASDRARRLGTREALLIYHAGAIRIARHDDRPGRELVRQALALNPSFDAHAAAEARFLLEPTHVASR